MEITKFSEMYSLDYNLNQLFAMNQKWSENQVLTSLNTPRQTSALVYYKNCAATFTLANGKILHIKKGSLVYIPQGACYKTLYYQCDAGTAQTQLLEFELINESNNIFVASPSIMVLQLNRTYDIDIVFDELVTIYNKPILSYNMMKSKCYAFLHEICKSFHYELMYSKKYTPIAAGIAYLEQKHSYDLSVAEIAQMCHVSESCFRKLFQQYSGVSPIQYKANNLLRQAKDMIRSGDLSIYEIALQLGFNDVGYFSRWFKKNTGISPSNFINSSFDTD